MQISDSTIPGLYLRYYARSNQISFYLGYRHLITKKTKNILIGRYCDFKLPEIKEKAIILRQMLAKGKDPIEELEKDKKKRLHF